MIKKTFQTLKSNPKIMLILSITFFYTAGTTLLTHYGVLPSTTIVDIMDVGLPFAIPPALIIKWLLPILYYVGLTFFITPLIICYIRRAIEGNIQEDWYKKDLEKSWWRYFVLGAIYMGVSMIITVPLVFIAIFAIAFSSANTIVLIISLTPFILVIFVLATFLYIGTSPAITHDNFGKGLGEMFSVGKKYFFKYLGVFLLTYIPIGIYMYVIFSDPISQTPPTIPTILMSLWGVFISAFLYTYSMELYLDAKEKIASTSEVQDRPKEII